MASGGQAGTAKQSMAWRISEKIAGSGKRKRQRGNFGKRVSNKQQQAHQR